MSDRKTLDQILHEWFTTDEQIDEMLQTFSNLKSRESQKLHIFCGGSPSGKSMFSDLLMASFPTEKVEVCQDIAFIKRKVDYTKRRIYHTYDEYLVEKADAYFARYNQQMFNKCKNSLLEIAGIDYDRELFNDQVSAFTNCMGYVRDGNFVPFFACNEVPKVCQLEETKKYCKIWHFDNLFVSPDKMDKYSGQTNIFPRKCFDVGEYVDEFKLLLKNK
jgi:hypothetical protein